MTQFRHARFDVLSVQIGFRRARVTNRHNRYRYGTATGFLTMFLCAHDILPFPLKINPIR
jgi:hypothetical protein